MDDLKAFIKTNFWLPIAIAVVAIALWQLVDPAPPGTLTLATGSPDGRYYKLGKLLEKDLAKQGVTLNVVSTAGSGDNMARLIEADGDVAIAFVQSGMHEMFEGKDGKLQSLGSFYYEPIWLFHNRALSIERLSDLAGLKVGIGEAGSGTQIVAKYIARENGLSAENGNVQFYELDADDTVEKLTQGELDAALFTVSPQSERIQALIHSPNIDFLDIKRSEAYTARYSFLSSVTIHEGLLDLEHNIPPFDRTTLASTATLLINDRFHPSVTPLVLEALSKHLKKGGVLEAPNEFPSPNNTDFPLSKEAEHYYEYGPPFLLRFMPFWAASLVDRLIIFVIPLLVILVPLSKLAGPIYRWRIRSRIYRWYRYLLTLDKDLAQGKLSDIPTEQQKLEDLTNELAQIEVPLSYADELYHLKNHLEYLKARLKNKI